MNDPSSTKKKGAINDDTHASGSLTTVKELPRMYVTSGLHTSRKVGFGDLQSEKKRYDGINYLAL
jgi:hypothetical protein